ncbi:MAG: hypothetical protein AABO58_11045 [Acidobacteriota bacterium]
MTEEKLAVLDAYTLCTLFDDVQRVAADGCYHAAVVHGIVRGAQSVILGSVLLVMLILLFVRLVRGHLRTVARLLPFVVVVVALWFVALTLGTAALILFTIFALSAVFVPIGILKVMIVIAAFGGVFKALRPLPKVAAVIRSNRADYDGMHLLASDAAPQLHALIEKAAARAGVAPPDHVIVGLHPGVWLAITPGTLGGRTLRGRSLYVSLPFCRLLTQAELEMLVAAELLSVQPHSAAIAASTRIARLSSGMQRLLEANFQINNMLVLPPAVGVFGLLQNRLRIDAIPALLEEVYGGDAKAARIYGVAPLVSALMKAHLHVLAWRVVLARETRPGETFRLTNLSERLLTAVASLVEAISKGGADEMSDLRTADLDRATYSTPRLEDRLSRLGAALTPAAVRKVRKPTRAAATLLPDAKHVEATLIAAAERELSKQRFYADVLAGLDSGPGA